tara:strand:+ start:272 stop:508 length:237 start_codon:yes stop_codon:yes gene_type:complete
MAEVHFQTLLRQWVGSVVTVHMSSGAQFTGLLSEAEETPGSFLSEAVQGPNISTTVFHGVDVVALTLPANKSVTKKPR